MRALAAGAFALAALACHSPERPAARARSAALVPGPSRLANLRTLPDGNAALVGGALVSAGERIYFTNGDETTGVELWASDGTAAGTHLLRDACPGTCSGYYYSLSGGPYPVEFGGLVLFPAFDGSTGTRPWRSDGTEAGTWSLKDVVPGPSGTHYGYAAALGDRAFFAAAGLGTGFEPFVTDGTPDGTLLLADLAAGPASSEPHSAVACGEKVFFLADPGGGVQLWATDLTGAGTAPVEGAPPMESLPSVPMRCRGTTLFFRGLDGGTPRLWRTDGTAGGTAMVSGSPESPALLEVSGSWLYFDAGPSGLRDLWRTDGTAAFKLTAGGRAIAALADAGGVPVVFDGKDPAVGTEPYFWSEAAQALVLLSDVAPGAGSSLGSYPVSSGGKAFFLSRQNRLWVTDGTTSGTVQATSVSPSTRWGLSLAAFQDGVAFLVEAWNATSGYTVLELWKSDGTELGSGRIAAVQVSPASSAPTGFTSLNGTAYFVARGDDGARALYRTDGTAAGTVSVQPYQPYLDVSTAREIVAWNGALWVAGLATLTGRELYRSDGVQPGKLVEDACPGSCDGLARDPRFTPTAGKLFFLGRSATGGLQLRATGPAGDSAALVMDLARTDSPFEHERLGVVGDTVFFPVGDGYFRNELWKTDGTAEGTVLVASFGLEPLGGPHDLTLFHGELYFSAAGPSGSQLFRTDGTGTGTVLVKDVWPWTLVPSGDALFFVVPSNVGRALWRSDGTAAGTHEVALFWDVSSMVAVDGAVYLAATDGASGFELWRSDGTAAGTARVVDAWPGPTGGLVGGPLFALPGTSLVFFPAADPVAGMELWVSNGSDGGTYRVADLRPGGASSSPADLAAAGGLLFFSASDGVTAREPWVVDVSALGDVVAPAVVCPASASAEATSPAGAAVAWAPATATDDVTPPEGIEIRYGAPSGATFPLGETLVAATAIDAAGNRRSCTFGVTVVDTVAPSLTCPPDAVAEATGPAGAPVSFAAAAVSDAATAEPSVAASPASGTTLPFGTTTVTLVATDGSGNATSCAFAVTVADTLPPAIGCPADRTVEATSPEGAIVTFAPASVEDAVTASPAISSAPPSGSTFPPGPTTVTLTATDAAANGASCTFTVTVVEPPADDAPGGSCGGCSTGGGAAVPLALLALLAPLRGPRPRPRRPEPLPPGA